MIPIIGHDWWDSLWGGGGGGGCCGILKTKESLSIDGRWCNRHPLTKLILPATNHLEYLPSFIIHSSLCYSLVNVDNMLLFSIIIPARLLSSADTINYLLFLEIFHGSGGFILAAANWNLSSRLQWLSYWFQLIFKRIWQHCIFLFLLPPPPLFFFFRPFIYAMLRKSSFRCPIDSAVSPFTTTTSIKKSHPSFAPTINSFIHNSFVSINSNKGPVIYG